MHYIFVKCRKAVVAGVGALLTSYAAAWNNDHIVDQTEWANILVGVILAVAAVWGFSNGKSNTNDSEEK